MGLFSYWFLGWGFFVYLFNCLFDFLFTYQWPKTVAFKFEE